MPSMALVIMPVSRSSTSLTSIVCTIVAAIVRQSYCRSGSTGRI